MPGWRDMRRFLERNAQFLRHGKSHDIYLFRGQRIRVSHGSGEISPELWKNILKHQLRMTQEEFNAGL